MRYMDRSRFWACDFWALFVIITCSCLLRTASGDPRTAVVGQFCGNSPSISGSVFAINSVPAMDKLSSAVTSNGYGTAVIGQAPNAVFVLGQCMEDLSPTDCKLCFSEIRSLLPKCYPNTTGRLYLDGCFGRYANYSFFDDVIDSLDQNVCTTGNNSASPNNFGKAVGEVIGNVTAKAIQKKGFAVGSASVSNTSAYALAQCWQNLTQSQCSTCLNAAASSIVSCLPAVEGRALFAGCYMRYSTKLFWNVYPNGSSSSDANHEKNLAWEQRIDIVQVVTEELSYLPLNYKFNSITPNSDDTRGTLRRQPRTLRGRRLLPSSSRSLYEILMETANNANNDARSFGLRVIEIVIQREHRPRLEVWDYYNHNRIEEIVETRFRRENTPDFIKHVIRIALSCTTNSGTTMAWVLEQLRAGPFL